jgi:hypothetical protein
MNRCAEEEEEPINQPAKQSLFDVPVVVVLLF